MPRKLVAPSAGNTLVTNVRIYQGGTDADNAQQARINLGLLDNSLKDLPDGFAGLDINGKINPNVIPNSVISNETTLDALQGTLFETGKVYVNATVKFQITNFDSSAEYYLDADLGVISISNDIVTWEVGSTTGAAAVTIGNRVLNYTVLAALIETPVLYVPDSTSSANCSFDQPNDVLLIASDFVSKDSTQIHAKSSWEVATDWDFTNIVDSNIETTDELTSWYLTGLADKTVYLVRVRYSNGVDWSDWSEPVPLLTKGLIPSVKKQSLPTDAITNNLLVTNFGSNGIALSGDGQHAIVGATSTAYNTTATQGAAYYYRKLSNVWTFVCKLPLPRVEANLLLGRSAALNHDGTIACVGRGVYTAYGKAGGFFMYRRVDERWIYVGEVVAGDTAVNDLFGWSLALNSDGTRIAVGAPGNTSNAGAVYLFTRDANVWTQDVKLTNPDHGSQFGRVVALSADGSRLIVGTPNDPLYYAYEYSVSGNTVTEIAGISVNTNDFYQASISGDGKNLYFGCNVNEGYLFRHIDNQWVQVKTYSDANYPAASYIYGVAGALNYDGTMMLLSNATTSLIGSEVFSFESPVENEAKVNPVNMVDISAVSAIRGDIATDSTGSILVVGDPEDVNTSAITGAFHYYKKVNSAWSYVGKITNPETVVQSGEDCQFGTDVSLSDDGRELLITDSGYNAIYYFRRTGDSWAFINKLTIAGLVKASFADISGDGVNAIVGDANRDSNRGAFTWLSRSGNTWSVVDTIQGPVTETHFAIEGALSKDKTFAYIVAAGANNQGILYKYSYLDATWAQTFIYEYKDANPENYTGRKLAISRDGQQLYALTNASGISAASYYLKKLNVDYAGPVEVANILNSSNVATGIVLANNTESIYIVDNASTSIKLADVSPFKNVGVSLSLTELATIQSPLPGTASNFGFRLAISADGKHLVASAVYAVSNQGRAYYYTFNDVTKVWVLIQTIASPDAANNEQFGCSVTMSADGVHLVIGADNDDLFGAAYYYTRSGSVWSFQQKFRSSNIAQNDHFGYDMSMSADGKLLVVSANRTASPANSGTVYTFTRTTGNWTEQSFMKAFDAVASDEFGKSVSLSPDGTKLLVSAMLDDDMMSDSGTVYYYTRENNAWVFQSKFYSPSPSVNENLGIKIQITPDGNYAFVSTFAYLTYTGVIYLFRRDGAYWYPVKQFTNSIPATNEFFGIGMSITTSDMLAVGVSGAAGGAGRVKLYQFNKTPTLSDYRTTVTDYNQSNATLLTRISAASAANDLFGSSIAVSNDAGHLVIGAIGQSTTAANSGAVYYFQRDTSGMWAFRTTLKAPDPTVSENFGRSVSISGDGMHMLVGCPGDTTSGANNGSVFYYTRASATATAWTFVNKFTGGDSINASDNFGTSVSMSNDAVHAVVSAPNKDNTQNDSGKIYYFTRTGNTWTQQSSFICPDEVLSMQFGIAVGISGDGTKLLVSTPFDTINSVSSCGTVYYFTRSVNTWNYVSKFQENTPGNNRNFGRGLAVNADGSMAVIGAFINGGANNQQCCFIYKREGDTWAYSKKFTNPYDMANSFGQAVAIDTNFKYMFVGAMSDPTVAASAGRVYLYLPETTTVQDILPLKYLPTVNNRYYPTVVNQDEGAENIAVVGMAMTRVNTLTDPTWANGDQFGRDIAVSGDGLHLLVSSHIDDNTGSCYYFELVAGVWTFRQKFKSSDIAASDYFGYSVAISKDGLHALVSALYDDDTGVNSGSVYYFTRSGTTWTQQQKITAPVSYAEQAFGTALALDETGVIGIIGAYNDNSKATTAGAFWYIKRTGGTWAIIGSRITASDGIASDGFGFYASMSSDGVHLLVGCLRDDVGASNAGSIYYYTRSGDTWTYVSTAYANDPTANAYFGRSFTMNADGDKFIAVNYKASPDIYYFERYGNQWVQVDKVTNILYTTENIELSLSVDRNFTKFYLGNSYDDTVASNAGAVYEYTLNRETYIEKKYTPYPFKTLISANPAASESFGTFSISKDGQHMVVGAQNNNGLRGIVYYFQRNGNNWTFITSFRGSDTVANDCFGNAVSLNYDGTKLVVGAYREAGTTRGMAYYFTRVGNVWTQQQKFRGSNTVADHRFGTGLCLSEDGQNLVVGTTAGGTGYGAFYYFTLNGSNQWVQQAIVGNPTPINNEFFSYRLSFNSDATLLACSCLYDNDKGTGVGSVFMYKRTGSNFQILTKVYAEDSVANLNFGSAVNLSSDGKTLAVGAMGDTSNAGAVYIFKQIGSNWIQITKFTNNPRQTGAYFGNDVCFYDSETKMAVGSHYATITAANQGAVYLFDLFYSASETGADIQTAKDQVVYPAPLEKYEIPEVSFNPVIKQGLVAFDAAANDGFGTGVSATPDGQHLLIGAWMDADQGTESGSVYYYRKVNGLYQYISKFNYGATNAGARLGISVVISHDGSECLVGACGSESKLGYVYYYTRSGDTWTRVSHFASSDNVAGDYFGQAIAASSDFSHVLVSAYRKNSTATDAGAVYYFTRSGAAWIQRVRINPPTATTTLLFGISLAMSADGTKVLIGNPNDPQVGSSGGGVIYYTRDGINFNRVQNLIPREIQANDNSGTAVAMSTDGRYALVSAHQDSTVASLSGAYYFFELIDNKWVQVGTKIKLPSPVANDRYGYSLAFTDYARGAVVAGYSKTVTVSGQGAAFYQDLYSVTGIKSDTRPDLIDTLYPSDAAAGDGFGTGVSVSADGQHLLIGAWRDDDVAADSGSVYYYRKVNGKWTQISKFQSNSPVANEFFGSAVGLSGDGTHAVIGARGRNTTGANQGAMYYYTRSGDTWTYVSRLTPSPSATEDQFSHSISLSADGMHAIISAPGADVGASNAGSIYYFVRDGAVWSQAQTWQATDRAADDQFGLSLCISGDGLHLLIGSQLDDDGGTNTGSVYYYTRTGNVWTYINKFYANDRVAGNLFGNGVALNFNGTIAYIGCVPANTAQGDEGRYYQFTRSGSTWTQARLITGWDPVGSGRVSTRIAMDGDTRVFTGKPAMHSDTGRVYYYDVDVPYNAGGLIYPPSYVTGSNIVNVTPIQTIVAPDAGANDYFGLALTTTENGKYLYIGAIGDDNGFTNSGSVYIYHEIDGQYQYVSTMRPSDAAANDGFGTAIAVTPDNKHMLIGSYFDDSTGSVYYYENVAGTWTQRQKIKSADIAANDYFGHAISISDDGLHALISAPYDNDQGTESGSIYYFTRSGAVWSQQHKLPAPIPYANAYFGFSLSMNAAGDIAVVGASNESTITNRQGAFWYIKRTGNTWAVVGSRVFPIDPAADDYFGLSVNLSRDGLHLLVGAMGKDSPTAANTGGAYYYKRVGDNWIYVSRFNDTSATANSYLGRAISFTSFNTRFIIGSHQKQVTLAAQGAVYVYNFIQPENSNLSFFGTDMAISENNQSLLIGVSQDNAAEGSVYFYRKIDNRYQYFNKFQAPVPVRDGAFGLSVAISADGIHAVVGEPGNSTNSYHNGAVHYYRSSGNGWALIQTFYANGALADESGFGSFLSMSADGTRLVVSAPLAPVTGINKGQVQVFTRSGDTWTHQQTIAPSDLIGASAFGASVAISGDGTKLLVAAFYQANPTSKPRFYYYNLTSNGFVLASQHVIEDIANYDLLQMRHSLNYEGNIAALANKARGEVNYYSCVGVTWNKVGSIKTTDIPYNAKLSSDGKGLLVNDGKGIYLKNFADTAIRVYK